MVTGRGRHTSSSAVALTLESGDEVEQAAAQRSWVIDTPGVRTFGLAHVDPDDVLAAFDDLVKGSADCEPGCAHESPAGGCALDAYVAAGHAGEHGPARLDSLRGLLQSLDRQSARPAGEDPGHPLTPPPCVPSPPRVQWPILPLYRHSAPRFSDILGH